MPYRILEDAFTADVGFVACGATLDECFAAAAEATLRVMLDNPAALQCREQRQVQVEDDALDLLLLRFLEELVYHKDVGGWLLRPHGVHVTVDDRRWRVTAVLGGEAIDPARHELAADVKGVTLHRLGVRRTATGWEATVVLDI
ncbi:MAG: archease [Candidatus Binatia bacterium]